MKKSIVLTATVAALSVMVSCEKTVEPQFIPSVKISAVAEKANPAENDESKTTMQSDGSVCWDESGEVLAILELSKTGEGQNLATCESKENYSLSSDRKKAYFSFELPQVTANTFEYFSVYPGEAFTGYSMTDGCISLTLPNEQQPTDNSSDALSSLMLATSETFTTQPESVGFGFKQMTACIKLSLNDIKLEDSETVESVSITVPDNKISGAFKWYWEDKTTEIDEENSYNNITVDASKLTLSSGSLCTYVNVLPFTLETGDKIVFVVNTKDNVYAKQCQMPSAKEFPAGQITQMAVDMSTATKGGTGVYAKITSEPSEGWAGSYLIVSESKNMAFNGAYDNGWGRCSGVTITTDKKIIPTTGMDSYEVVISKGSSAYTIKLSDGKYMSWTGRDFAAGTTAQEYSISLDANSNVLIYNNKYLKYNTAGGLRSYGENDQISIQLYAKNGSSIPTATVTTEEASDISSSEATLNLYYTGATSDGITPAEPNDVHFIYGLSSSALDLECAASGQTEPFSAHCSGYVDGLSAGTTYYYAGVVEIGGRTFSGEVKSFTTADSPGPGPGPGPTPGGDAFKHSFLSLCEMPETDVTLTTDDVCYEGHYCNSTVSETHGTTKACIYNTTNASRRIVTHTFTHNNKVKRTYTLLYDKDKRCALWCAFAMHGTEFKDNNLGRQNGWTYDPAIPTDWQPNLSNAYTGNYSRGHQVASNDRQTVVEENKQTFYYSNMTPQSQSLNGGTWNTLESEVQKTGNACTGLDTLFVVTGPLFQGTWSTTTDKSGNVCPIPTHYFKCTMKCTFNDAGEVVSATGAGYLFLHDGTNAPRQTVSIDYIESLCGFDLFANVPKTIQDEAEK